MKFACAIGLVDAEQAETISIGHMFRNETYHVGVQHEEVLPAITRFYFSVGCEVLSRLEPRFLSWCSSDQMPERAQKYFKPGLLPGSFDEMRSACAKLAEHSGHSGRQLVATLSDHFEKIVDGADEALRFIAEDSPRPSSRDEAVLDLQAWAITFSEEGAEFMRARGAPPGSVFSNVAWLTSNYPFQLRRDPIAAWRRRAAALRKETNPHVALKKYRGFLDQTRAFLGWLDESAAALDAEIDRQIDEMRGR